MAAATSAPTPLLLTSLRDHELQFVFARVDCARALGRLSSVSHRLRSLLERDGGVVAWRGCRGDALPAGTDWAAAPRPAPPLQNPHNPAARAVAIGSGCALFPDEETSCVLVRAPAPGQRSAAPALSLRDTAAAAQGEPGKVLLALYREDEADPRPALSSLPASLASLSSPLRAHRPLPSPAGAASSPSASARAAPPRAPSAARGCARRR